MSTNVACVGMSMPEVGSSRTSRSGSPDQGAGDEHPLLLSAGHLLHALERAVGQAHVGQRRERAPPVPAGRSQRPAVQQPGRHDLVGGRRDAGGGGQPLRHVPDPVPGGGRAERRAEQPHVTGGAGDHAEQRAHEGGLAGAVGAEQGEHLAGGHDEVDAVEDRLAAERHAEAGRLDHGGAHEQDNAMRSAARLASAIEK